MKDELTILQEAKALIERGWCRDTYAVTADGSDCPPDDELAVKWCMSGALYRASGRHPYDGATRYHAAVAAQTPYGMSALAVLNDAPETTKAMVLAVFDAAIAECQAAQVPV